MILLTFPLEGIVKKNLWLVAFAFMFVLASCQTEQQVIVVTATPEPTDIPTATEPPAPTPTTAPTLEPTPEGQIFYDGFDGELKPDWEVVNENSLKWAFSDGWLKIVAEDNCLLHEPFQRNMFLLYAPEESFVIETLVKADADTNFQQASIYVMEDDSNYFTINRGYCQPCSPKGAGLYSDYSYKSEMSGFNGRVYKDEMVYLRIAVNRDRKEIIAYYSEDGEKWTQLRKIPLVINVNQIGLGASNCDSSVSSDDDLVAEFDYFEVKELE